MIVYSSTNLDHAPQSVLFERLKMAILEAGNGWIGNGVVLTDAQWRETEGTEPPFLVVVTPEFRVLVQANAPVNGVMSLPSLTMDPQAIAVFLKKLRSRVSKQPALKTQVAQALSIAPQVPTDPSVYEALIQQLFSLLGQALIQTSSPTALTCQPLVEAALYQQVQQEQLINQVTTQIRQSLELPVILQTAVDKVQECLAVDRLLIYQFNALPEQSLKSGKKANQPGSVAYESCAQLSMPSFATAHWGTASQPYQRYCQGQRLIAERAQSAADLLDGPTELLYQHQVKAQLVMPLLVQDRLWGLLIAHRCEHDYAWESREIEFLDHITEHLAIAIHQAELYQQLQSQKQTLEEQVNQRTQELQAALVETQTANQAKSEFLATISHELRTPLTCVIGMSATLIRWSLGPLNDKQREYLQTIYDSGEHLLELINDILDVSQAESGKATLELSEFSLSTLVQSTVQVLREQAAANDLNLRTMLRMPPERDRFVADARRVKQILFSLLSNAIKFTPAGGEVVLRVWVEANAAVFQVEDNGIGIPAHQQPLLFQKFQQLDTSYRRAYDGAGLGLALAKQMVDLHRGWIEVNSVEGQGSIFTVEIPNQILAKADKIEPRSAAPIDPKSRIVLIEDQEESATLICEMLTAAGYHVVWIVEDSTALQQMQFLRPTAAIISADRLNGKGLRLIQQLRQVTQPSGLKVIALAPKAEPYDPQVYLAAGADTVLTKPLSPEYLVHKVGTLLTHPQNRQG